MTMTMIFIVVSACTVLHDLSRTVQKFSQDMKFGIHARSSDYLERAQLCFELMACTFFNTHYAFKAELSTKGVDFRPAVAYKPHLTFD